MRKDIASQQNANFSSDSRQNSGQNDFINIFAINRGDEGDQTRDGDADSDRELYDDEKDILKQFEDNDKELEEIAA